MTALAAAAARRRHRRGRAGAARRSRSRCAARFRDGGLDASRRRAKTGNWRIDTAGHGFRGLLGGAAGAAAQHRQAQGQGGRARDRDPRPLRRSAPGPITKRSIGRAGSPRKAPSPSFARWPSRKARPGRCGSASPARTGGRSPRSSGWSRMARRRSTSSLMPRMPRRCRPAPCSAWRCSAARSTRTGSSAIDYGTGDDGYKTRLDGRAARRSGGSTPTIRARCAGLAGAARAAASALVARAAKPLGATRREGEGEHGDRARRRRRSRDHTARGARRRARPRSAPGSPASTRRRPCSARCPNSIRWRWRAC